MICKKPADPAVVRMAVQARKWGISVRATWTSAEAAKWLLVGDSERQQHAIGFYR